MARTRNLGMCVLWPWPWRYDLGSKSWHTLGSWTTIMWNIIQIQQGSEELWPGHGFWVCWHCDLDLGDMTLYQGHDLGSRSWHILGSRTIIMWNIIQIGQGVKKLWPRHDANRQTDGRTDSQTDRAIPIYPPNFVFGGSSMAVRSYGQVTEFGYVCTVTLTLEIWPWVKVMTHPWVMDNNYVKYYPDPTRQWGVMAWTRILGMRVLWTWPWRYDLGSRSWHILGSWTIIVWNIIQIRHGVKKLWPGHDVNRQTDRQTGWFLYTPPPTLFAGGYKKIEHSYYKYIFLKARPFCRCQIFSTRNLDFNYWPNFEKMKMPNHNYFITGLQKLGAGGISP